MKFILRNSAFSLLAILIVSNFASADVTIGDFATLGSSYSIEVGSNGGTAGTMTTLQPGVVDAVFDGATGSVGPGFVAANEVFVSETFSDNGGGNFQLDISVTSDGNLAPALFLNGTTATNAVLFVGQNLGINGNNLPVLTHEATSATVTTFDQNGNQVATRSVLGLAAFNLNGVVAWRGFIGAAVANGALGGSSATGDEDRIAETRLTIVGTIPVSIPEPASATILCGLGLLGLVRRRR